MLDSQMVRKPENKGPTQPLKLQPVPQPHHQQQQQQNAIGQQRESVKEKVLCMLMSSLI